MNEHGPKLHKEEKPQVGKILQREDEWENVVWQALQEAVHWVECDRGIGCWHDPFMVCLMQMLVDQRVMETAVDEVDERVGKHEEEWELEPVVVWVWFVGKCVVEFRVTLDLEEEEGSRHERNPWHSIYGLTNLHPDLVLEKFRVLESCFVEDEHVGE